MMTCPQGHSGDVQSSGFVRGGSGSEASSLFCLSDRAHYFGQMTRGGGNIDNDMFVTHALKSWSLLGWRTCQFWWFLLVLAMALASQ
jgi:hypothetical protein